MSEAVYSRPWHTLQRALASGLQANVGAHLSESKETLMEPAPRPWLHGRRARFKPLPAPGPH